jgi:hypothetical protein
MIIALFVLAVVLISMVGMFLISHSAIYTKEDETANALALRFLEQCEAVPFAELKSGTFPALNPPTKYNVLPQTLPGGDDYAITLRVTVTWKAANSGTRNLSLERVISAGGHKNVGELN